METDVWAVMGWLERFVGGGEGEGGLLLSVGEGPVQDRCALEAGEKVNMPRVCWLADFCLKDAQVVTRLGKTLGSNDAFKSGTALGLLSLLSLRQLHIT